MTGLNAVCRPHTGLHDLLDLPSPQFVLERGGAGVAGLGVSRWVHATSLHAAASSARAALAAIEWDRHRPAPIVMGALPFDPDVPIELVIPRRAVRMDRPGESWSVQVAPHDEGPADASEPEPPVLRLQPGPDPSVYVQAVRDALERIHAADLEKVVLARTLVASASSVLDPLALARRLRARDPEASTFLSRLSDGSCFVGATPEILVVRRGVEVSAVPLAGSRPRSPSRADDDAAARELIRSDKDRREHELVVLQVEQVLAQYCDCLDVDPEPVLAQTATMWHLQTGIRGTLREPAPDALELAAALHPTPAVCGTPTVAALQAIRELEPVDRGMYAGLVGWVDARGDGEWAVSLRCAHIHGATARLYAGAGIVAGSDPHLELAETDAKFRAVLEALGAAAG